MPLSTNANALRLPTGSAGRIITQTDSDYDKLRSVMYGGYDKRPGAIVRVANAEDVAAAAHGELKAVITGMGDGGCDVGSIGHANDGSGPLVIAAIHDGTGLVVVGISRSDDPAGGSGGQA